MRREPAHREAYVRLTKAQVEFPHIQSAYAAVERWIDRNGWRSPTRRGRSTSPISFRPARLTKSVTSRSRFADDDPLLSIGVFARRSRLSMKALRLYDRLGLLKPADVDPENGYRRYRESQLVTARLVVMLRRLDMPLAQVAEIVSAPGPLAVERLRAYWEAFERRVAGQRELVAHIQSRLSGEEGNLPFGEIRQRQVPEQLVLTEQRHVQVEHLPSWIGAAMGRLMKSARRYGGLAGDPFVVYYGEVNEDSDGPAEACVPIDPGAGSIGGRGDAP